MTAIVLSSVLQRACRRVLAQVINLCMVKTMLQ